jgi:hypothetical protein
LFLDLILRTKKGKKTRWESEGEQEKATYIPDFNFTALRPRHLAGGGRIRRYWGGVGEGKQHGMESCHIKRRGRGKGERGRLKVNLISKRQQERN